MLVAAMASQLYRGISGAELVFDETGEGQPLEVYFDVLGIDPVNEEMQARLDFTTRTGPHAGHWPGVPSADLVVHVGDAGSVRDVSLAGGQPASSVQLRLDLTGSVDRYPLDRYRGQLAVSAQAAGSGGRIPVHLRIWPSAAPWLVDMTPARASAAGPRGLELDIDVHRPPSAVVIGLVIYGSMALVGLGGLVIGALVFLGVRRIETTLAGALGAMVFAVPALRRILPGDPPLGVHADVLVFMWVEIAVIVGLTLFIAAWARRGPPP